jgi:hypothetical protein
MRVSMRDRSQAASWLFSGQGGADSRLEAMSLRTDFLVGSVVEDAAGVVAEGVTQGAGEGFVGLDAAIEADPFAGVADLAVLFDDVVGKLEGDVAVGGFALVEGQGAAGGFEVYEVKRKDEAREGGAESAVVHDGLGGVAVAHAADLDALALGGGPTGGRWCGLGFLDLGGIDIAQEVFGFVEEGLFFSVIPDVEDERGIELGFGEMRGGLPAFVEAGAFALRRARLALARNSQRAHLVAAMGDEEFGSGHAGACPALGALLEGFAVVVGGEEFFHGFGNIDFDEEIGVENGIGDAVRRGDDGVSFLILAAEEEGIDAIDRGGGGCVDEEQMGAHFPIGMCEADDEGLEGDIVDVGQPGGADFVFAREDGFFRVRRVVGFRLHLDEVHGAAFLHEDVGADK